MQHNKLFVFDIETVPDGNVIPNLTGEKNEDIKVLREALSKYHLEITGGKSDFPRQPFWKVVAISFLEADIHRNGRPGDEDYQEYYTFKRLESNRSDDEGEMVSKFFEYFDRSRPRLVSYNGRTFDVPVLKYRAMAYGVSSKWLHKGGDKWNSYNSRYSQDWHCDLLDALSDYGASARCKMNEVCSIMGFPGKFGVDGSKVTDMYDDGKIDAIKQYCETDVLNTYLVYLRYQQHTGTLSLVDYNQAIEDILEFIKTEKTEKPYLEEFREAWEESCGGNYIIGDK
jgi:predicted PolB exonuclease-like 3'-5' exonuclease